MKEFLIVGFVICLCTVIVGYILEEKKDIKLGNILGIPIVYIAWFLGVLFFSIYLELFLLF